tara:strand:- start:214 stop:570 length:357 start_codon:yes stop_codon:yes gene_type:complete
VFTLQSPISLIHIVVLLVVKYPSRVIFTPFIDFIFNDFLVASKVVSEKYSYNFNLFPTDKLYVEILLIVIIAFGVFVNIGTFLKIFGTQSVDKPTLPGIISLTSCALNPVTVSNPLFT